ncbi:hypothetical protein ES703_120584 [subsurface metagenome]
MLFGYVIVEFYFDILFHLLIVGKVQLVVIFALNEIAVRVTVSAADSRLFIVYPAPIVFFREVSTFVVYVNIPVAVLYEDRYVFMAQKPPYVVVVSLIFRRINRQSKIPAAQPNTLFTLTFLSH